MDREGQVLYAGRWTGSVIATYLDSRESTNEGRSTSDLQNLTIFNWFPGECDNEPPFKRKKWKIKKSLSLRIVLEWCKRKTEDDGRGSRRRSCFKRKIFWRRMGLPVPRTLTTYSYPCSLSLTNENSSSSVSRSEGEGEESARGVGRLIVVCNYSLSLSIIEYQ
jgi:hypothetical protein